MEEEYKQEIKEIVSEVDAVSIFGKVTPEEMMEEQQKDLILELIYKQVTAGKKPKTSTIAKVKSEAVRKYLLQFDQLTLKKGVLHRLYINDRVPPVHPPTSAHPVAWWSRPSGIRMHSCLMLGKILLE